MRGVEKKESIIVCNATENNLKNITVEIPIDAFSCVTGPSGCGKSSLIYDTIFAESQRNFLESMSGNLYGQKLMDKPRVDEIKNLRPALNVSQTYYNVNPRSTIGTITDVSYYLRALFAVYASVEYGKEVDINYFSPNNPASCCKKCKGLGEEYVVSEELLIPDMERTLDKGGITYFKGSKTSLEYKLLEANCEHFGINISKKISDLSPDELSNLLYREDNVEFHIRFKTPKGRVKQKTINSKGVIPELNDLLADIDIPSTFASISKYLVKAECSYCGGAKLKNEVLNIRVNGLNISEAEKLSFDNLLIWIEKIQNNSKEIEFDKQMKQLLIDMKKRVKTLINLNLGYLNLSRSIPSLSGGEVQRVRLANQLTCSLNGLLYILDEPCKGLHYKNINSIINASRQLVDKGNTLIAIEHNKQFISHADNIIELGPVGGPKGGYILSDFGKKSKYNYDIRFKQEATPEQFISLQGVNHHNLKDLSVNIPIGVVTCITGVSGSGKSTLTEVIGEVCAGKRSSKVELTSNTEYIKRVMRVNQQPIGKTPRSTVVSYLEIYDSIRNKFSESPKAKELGLTSSDFSMNVDGGRCECCQGTGKKKIELSYMPDTYVVCPECHGKRFHNDVIEVRYRNHNIIDILDKSIGEILPVFEDDITIYSILQCMCDMGLNYLSLGQMSMTLSGGEAQRIKLAKCLGAKSSGKNMYILDEPTSGLHEMDIKLLEDILGRLRENKETIIIIEHNIEFISHVADYLVDLGTVAGNNGGNIILQGNPQTVMNAENSSWAGYEDVFM